MDETELIHAISRAFAEYGLSLDASDDCGHWAGDTHLVTTDTLVENRHFDRHWDAPRDIGRQAAIVNLSDIAGSGGSPTWTVWSLVLNANWTTDDVVELARGFGHVMSESECTIIGGNLAWSPGPSSIAVTVGGTYAGAGPLRRDGARPGDAVYVSGCLGTSSMGYLAPHTETRRLRYGWRPHLSEARELGSMTGVSACMDISDGLLIDAHRLADASQVCLQLHRAMIPVHPRFEDYVNTADAALFGGEDYVLLFTAQAGVKMPEWATCIGQCTAGRGVYLDRTPIDPLGHDHFDRTVE